MKHLTLVIAALAFATFTANGTAEQDSPDALLDAIELCKEGECAQASALADDLEPGTTRDLLVAWTNWRAKPERTSRQRRLDRALGPFLDEPPTPLSRAAFRSRYEFDFSRGDYGRAYETAGEAADHFRPAEGMGLNEDWARARMAELTSDVSRGNIRRPHLLMAHFAGRLWRDKDLALNEDATRPEWILPLFWEAIAWETAIEAVVETRHMRNKADPAQIAAIFESYGLTANGVPQAIQVQSDLPFCDGDFDRTPPISYPPNAVRRDAIGAVVLGFDLDAGRPTNVQVLAAVPNGMFEAHAEDTLKQWTYRPNIDQMTETCAIDAVNLTQVFQFYLD